ncbi:unnamed protein product, partial [marine sediment metagenome]
YVKSRNNTYKLTCWDKDDSFINKTYSLVPSQTASNERGYKTVDRVFILWPPNHPRRAECPYGEDLFPTRSTHACYHSDRSIASRVSLVTVEGSDRYRYISLSSILQILAELQISEVLIVDTACSGVTSKFRDLNTSSWKIHFPKWVRVGEPRIIKMINEAEHPNPLSHFGGKRKNTKKNKKITKRKKFKKKRNKKRTKNRTKKNNKY